MPLVADVIGPALNPNAPPRRRRPPYGYQPVPNGTKVKLGRRPTDLERRLLSLSDIPVRLDADTANLTAALLELRRDQLETADTADQMRDVTEDLTELLQAAQGRAAEYGAFELRQECSRQRGVLNLDWTKWNAERDKLGAHRTTSSAVIPRVVFHGTSKKHLDNILAKGIKASSLRSLNDVFVTSDLDEARYYAKTAGGKSPVVLEIHVPRHAVDEFKHEWTTAYRHRGTIPAQWIKQVIDGKSLSSVDSVFFLVVDLESYDAGEETEAETGALLGESTDSSDARTDASDRVAELDQARLSAWVSRLSTEWVERARTAEFRLKQARPHATPADWHAYAGRGLEIGLKSVAKALVNRSFGAGRWFELKRAQAMDEFTVALIVFTSVLDANTCFPAGTLISTETGYRPIEQIVVGERVVGDDGQLSPVLSLHEDDADSLVEIRTGRMSLRCTPEHHIWVCRVGTWSWVEASEICAGDFILVDEAAQTQSETQRVEDDGIENTDGTIASGDGARALGGVARVNARGVVPVSAIHVDDEIGVGNVEIPVVSSARQDRELCFDDDPEVGHLLAEHVLDRGLSGECHVALEGAESAQLGSGRGASKDESARLAGDADGRASTAFGTVPRIWSSGRNGTGEELAAPLASPCLPMGELAGPRANLVVAGAGVGLEGLSTEPTGQSDASGASDLVAVERAILASGPLLVWNRAEDGSALSAGSVDVRLPHGALSAVGTVDGMLPTSRVGISDQTGLPAAGAGHLHLLPQMVVDVRKCDGPVRVFNLTIAHRHLLLANGILASNCDECEEADGTTFREDSDDATTMAVPYYLCASAQGGDNLCRCIWVALDEEEADLVVDHVAQVMQLRADPDAFALCGGKGGTAGPCVGQHTGGGTDKPASREKDVTTEQEKLAWTVGPPKMPDNFKTLPDAERDAVANAALSVPARIAELTTDQPWANTGSTKADITTRIEQCRDKLAPEGARLVTGLAHEFAGRIEAVAGDTPEARVLTQQLTDAMIAQEVEAATRTLGDHGAHHLAGNDRIAAEVLKAMGAGVSKEDRLAMTLAAAFHDTGYLTPPARAWQDSDHPRWSQQNYDANVAPLVTAALGPQVSARISEMIRTHDSTEMDWQADPATSAVRLADNLALFHEEKTPPLFRYVPENRGVMERFANGEIDVATAQTQIAANVAKSSLPAGVKSQLTRATTEVSDRLPKFVSGMWSGSISAIDWDKTTSSPVVHITNKGNDALMKRLDMGQAQFAKLAKTYGKTVADFKASNSVTFGAPPKTLVTFKIRGKKLMRRDGVAMTLGAWVTAVQEAAEENPDNLELQRAAEVLTERHDRDVLSRIDLDCALMGDPEEDEEVFEVDACLLTGDMRDEGRVLELCGGKGGTAGPCPKGTAQTNPRVAKRLPEPNEKQTAFIQNGLRREAEIEAGGRRNDAYMEALRRAADQAERDRLTEEHFAVEKEIRTTQEATASQLRSALSPTEYKQATTLLDVALKQQRDQIESDVHAEGAAKAEAYGPTIGVSSEAWSRLSAEEKSMVALKGPTSALRWPGVSGDALVDAILHGMPVEVPEMVFHGTSEEHLKSILKNGLDPKFTGANYQKSARGGAESGSVFVSTSLEKAKEWASDAMIDAYTQKSEKWEERPRKGAAPKMSGKLVVLHIRIPPGERKAVVDEEGAAQDIRFSKVIPPSWIVRAERAHITSADPSKFVWNPVKLSADPGAVVYAAVVLDWGVDENEDDLQLVVERTASRDVALLSDAEVEQLFFELCGGKGGTAGPCPFGGRGRGSHTVHGGRPRNREEQQARKARFEQYKADKAAARGPWAKRVIEAEYRKYIDEERAARKPGAAPGAAMAAAGAAAAGFHPAAAPLRAVGVGPVLPPVAEGDIPVPLSDSKDFDNTLAQSPRVRSGSATGLSSTENTSASFKIEDEEGRFFVFKPTAGESFKMPAAWGGGDVRYGVTNTDAALAEREVLGARFDQALGFGLVPTTIQARVTPAESTRAFKAGGSFTWDKEEPGSLQEWRSSRALDRALVPRDEIARMGILDAVIGNLDRHRSNYLVSPSGHLIAIDHGYAFTSNPVTPLRGGGTHVPELRSWALHNIEDGDLSADEQTKIADRIDKMNLPDLLGGSHLNKAERSALAQRLRIVRDHLRAGRAHHIRNVMKPSNH